MRGRQVRTVVALAPILIAVLVAAAVAGCTRDRGPQPSRSTTLLGGLGRAGVPPAAMATPNPTRLAPTTTTTRRRVPTTTTARPAATTDSPSGPRMLFGIGPEADQARASPLARQAPVRMLWAAGLRGFMTQIAGPTSGVDWSGTFGWILVPGIGVGALLGWAEQLRSSGGRRGWRWLALAPLLFSAILFSRPSTFAGPDLALDTPRGAWVAVYSWSFLAVLALTCTIPIDRSHHRTPPDPDRSTADERGRSGKVRRRYLLGGLVHQYRRTRRSVESWCRQPLSQPGPFSASSNWPRS